MMYQKKSSGYPAIQRVVKKGYFSTFDKGKTFFPDKPVSRKELALIVDRLLQLSQSNDTLTRAEMQELSLLSKNFKSYLVSQKLGESQFSQDVKALKTEQTILHHDLSALQTEITTLKKTNETQQLWIWGLLGLGILGIAI